MRLFLLVLCLLLSVSGLARTCISCASGNWESNTTWLCDGVPSIPAGGDDVVIQAGHIVKQSSNHTPPGSGPMNIYVFGTWNFGNGAKIYLPCNSYVSVEPGGSVTASGGGSSNRIEICNSVVWKASDGDLHNPIQFGTPPASPLPVELLSLKGKNQGHYTELEWVTASETNNDFFEVERSTDGKTFVKVGLVDGAGNSEIPRFYVFNDYEAESGINYYRLKQVDFDGKTHFSDLIVVKSGQKHADPLIFPNPATGGVTLTLAWDGFLEPGAHLLVIDLSGRLVYSLRIDSPNRLITLPVSEIGVRAGTYFVRFRSGETELQVPLVIH